MSTQPLFEIYAGDDYALKVAITDVDGTPLDVTGYVFSSTMKLNPTLPDDEAFFVTDVLAQDPLNGIVYLALDSAQTRTMGPGKYSFDLQMVSPVGTVHTLLVGKIKVHTDVTYRAPTFSQLGG